MHKLPQSNHHPLAFREIPLPSGKIIGIWADTLLELTANGDWRLVSTFHREVALNSFLLLLSWEEITWADTGVTLDRADELQLSPSDLQALHEWLNQALAVAWFDELKDKAYSAVTRLQAAAVTALSQAVRQPGNIYLEISE